MFKLDNPEMLLWFAFAPALLLLYVLMRRWKRSRIRKFGDPSLVKRLYPDVSLSRPLIKFILLFTAFIFLVIGLCGPLIGSKLEEVKRKGSDIIIALDVSNSMLAEDIRPSRIERAKQALNRLVDRLEGDRLGIIVFAGEAFVQLPITTDYNAAKMFISSISTDMVPSQGTAIGTAIGLAQKSFSDTTRKHSALVIITDGENHEDDALEAAREAADAGIKIFTIGFATDEGAPIPVRSNNAVVGYLKDENGNTVVTKLNAAVLNEVADAGRGRFVKATSSDDGLGVIVKDLGAMDKKEFKAKMYTDYENQFQYFIGVALLLLVLEFMLGEKKSRWLAKLNLFTVRKKEDIV